MFEKSLEAIIRQGQVGEELFLRIKEGENTYGYHLQQKLHT